MGYYFLEESCNKDVGRNFPQSIALQSGYDPGIENGLNKLMNCVNQLPDFEPTIDNVVLATYAKLTDVISTAYFNHLVGKLVNQRTLDVFLQQEMPPHKVYPVSVVYKDKHYQYYWLHIISNEHNLINFKRSKYMRTSALGGKIGEISILSYNDYIKEVERGYQGSSIEFELLYLYSRKMNLDIFKTGAGLFNFFITGKFKSALEANEITGLTFRELPDWIHFE